jgi:hypothetical protein
MKHIFSRSLEIFFTSESGKRNSVGEEVDFEDVTFVHGVGKVALVAAIMFGRGTNVPSKLAMSAKRSASISRGMSNDFGARRCKWSAVEIEVAEHGSVGGEGRMNTGRSKEIES